MGQKEQNQQNRIERLDQALQGLDFAVSCLRDVTASASWTTDLSPGERALVNEMFRLVQDVKDHEGASWQQSAAPAPQVETDPSPPPRPAAEAPPLRRKAGKRFDTTLLLGADQAGKQGQVASQDRLFLLCQTLDPLTKRPSLIAKLNRWKNNNGWVRWTIPEDITLTEEGEAQLQKHLDIARTHEDLDAIHEAFRKAWGFTPST